MFPALFQTQWTFFPLSFPVIKHSSKIRFSVPVYYSIIWIFHNLFKQFPIIETVPVFLLLSILAMLYPYSLPAKNYVLQRWLYYLSQQSNEEMRLSPFDRRENWGSETCSACTANWAEQKARATSLQHVCSESPVCSPPLMMW